MIFDPATASHLKPWLVRTLEPICDAEPGALADYILALLKHNVPESEMRKELGVQLDEFLEKECSSFIDTLFTVLRTKTYLPYVASPASSSYPSTPKNIDNGIPIPLDALMSPPISSSPDRTRKRSIDNDERDGRPPAKGPRISTDGQFSRYNTNGRPGMQDSRSTGGWSGRVERPPVNGNRDGGAPTMAQMGVMNAMGGINGMNGRQPQPYRPPDQKRGTCRDYHNSGYCARGAFCKYSHGEDAVVPGQIFPGPLPPLAGAPMPFMPMFPNGGSAAYGMVGQAGGAYDPHEARMDMRPQGNPGRSQGRAPLLPRVQQEDGSRVMHHVHTSGELPVIQDLTPSIPPDQDIKPTLLPDSQLTTQPQIQSNSQSQSPSHPLSQLPPQVNQIEGFDSRTMNGPLMQHTMQPPRPMNGYMGVPMDVDMARPMPMSMGSPMNIQGNNGGNGGGGYRNNNNNNNNGGGMRGPNRPRGTFNPEVHTFRPERRNDKTLVVEKIPDDKLTLEHVNEWFKRFGVVTNVAIDSANAKALVSFANHDDAHTAWKSEDAVFGNRFVKLFWHRPMEGHGQVGARLLAASAPIVANMTHSTSPAPVSAPPPVASTSTPRKQSTPSATSLALAAKQQLLEKQISEQKALMASLDTASADEKKGIMARLRRLGEEMKPPTATAPVPTITSTSASPKPKPKTPIPSTSDHERKEKERLDKELELHSASIAVDSEESTEDLKAKLERLKAEAASLGLAEAAEPTSYGGGGGGSYRPYRGRGRGVPRSYYRGAGAMRGGPPRASMKLDNRPKKLLIKGVSEEGVQALRDWYETTGQVEAVDRSDNGEVIVAFRTRGAAEQGLAKGHDVPTVGPVQVSWFTGSRPPSVTPFPKAPSSSSMPGAVTATESKSTPQERMRSLEPETPHSPHSHIQEEEAVASGWGGDDEGDGMGML